MPPSVFVSELLSPSFSPGHHHEEATQTPFSPDLRCPANVSPPNNRCAGPQAWAHPVALSWGALTVGSSGEMVQMWIKNHTSGLKLHRLRFINCESQRTGRAPTRPPLRPVLRFYSLARTCPFVLPRTSLRSDGTCADIMTRSLSSGHCGSS